MLYIVEIYGMLLHIVGYNNINNHHYNIYLYSELYTKGRFQGILHKIILCGTTSLYFLISYRMPTCGPSKLMVIHLIW